MPKLETGKTEKRSGSPRTDGNKLRFGKAYNSPKIEVLGDIEKLTNLQAGPNTDLIIQSVGQTN